MRPNQTYLEHFSDLFQAHKRDHVSIGLYASVSVIAEQNGLKACLENVFGPKRTKSILDYAMYAVSCQSSVSPYSAKMARNRIFSDKMYPDSYWSVFFDRKITKEEMDRFKELWVLQCTRNGISTGYVSWDGSSKDGNRKDAEEANPGKTTLGTGGSQYGILYGVAPDGMPVTYDVYDGNVPDALHYVPLRGHARFYGHVDLTNKFDLAILLDYGTVKNIGGTFDAINNAKYLIEIDHHKNDNKIGNLCLDDDTAAATGCVLYDLMIDAGWKYDDKVLNLIALAILTDTGNFKYARDGRSLRIMAELVDAGVDINRL